MAQHQRAAVNCIAGPARNTCQSDPHCGPKAVGKKNREIEALRSAVEGMDESAVKIYVTPAVGHELFKAGTLTSKVPQFELLASGNPEPPSTAVSPVYQITVDAGLRREKETVL